MKPLALLRSSGMALVLAVLTALSPGTSPVATAQPNPPPVPMTQANAGDFTLSWGVNSDRRTAAQALRSRVNAGGARVTVADLLNAAGPPQTATRDCWQATSPGGALYHINAGTSAQHHVTVTESYCLNHRDSTTSRWTPQGVSGTEDAYQRGTVNGRRAILISWHSGPVGGQGRGTRLTFLLPTGSGTTHYVHVRLVRPNTGGTSYGDVNLHTGGVVWYRNYIFVPDVPRPPTAGNPGGVHIYDLRYLLDLATSPHHPIGHHPNWIGRHNGRYYGRGYRFLLPEIGRWNNQASATTRYDYISLDRARSPVSQQAPQFLTGEYRESRPGRVARWRTSAIARFPALNSPKTIHPFRAWSHPDPYVQGGFSHSCYYFNIGGGSSGNHYLIVARPNQTPRWHNGAWTLQDLYWRRSRNELWTITERRGVGDRVLYGIVRPSCP